MKKICCAVLVALGLMLPNAAKAETMGVYVAPKFVLNVQHFKGELSALGESGSKSKTEASAGGAIAIGYDFAPKFNIPVRAELEYGAYGDVSKSVSYEEAGFKASFEASVGVQTLLANVYWDIATWNNFTPYVGAGIGLAFVKTEGSLGVSYGGVAIPELSGSRDDSKTVFAGQVGFGCSYAITENISADLGYRFLMMGDGEVSTNLYGEKVKLESQDNYAHQLMLGVRVTF